MKSKKLYTVKLTTCGNPDAWQDPNESLWGIPNKTITGTIKKCQNAVKKYLEYYNIGYGNWAGGQVSIANTNKQVGYISYNGKYWINNEKEI